MAHDSNGTPSKFGFGLMRLPRKGIAMDIAQIERMTDLFLDAGFTYFDTAFLYPGSEATVKKVLVSRHARESFTLATKLFAAIAPTAKIARQEFETSLRRTGAEYFDYYLLHCLMDGNYKKYENYGLWDFVAEKKAQGLIRQIGFSFHAGPALLDRLLTAHPEVDFVQLQINYADWENPSVMSRANYEVARKHRKAIVVMEPVKGGALAKPPRAVQELFRACHPDWSAASWAIRFAASLEGILTVLSGMSSVAQMEDNLSYMRDFRPLNDAEQNVIQEARRILKKSKDIPCTACHYCTAGCPKQIPIPEIFAAMNKRLGSGQIEEAAADYQTAVAGKGRASECVACRQCENACPQHLPIVTYLEECRQLER